MEQPGEDEVGELGEDEVVPGELFEGIELPQSIPHPRADPADAAPSCIASIGASQFAQYRNREPALLRGLAARWPAISRWSQPAYLGTLADDGDDPVLVLCSRDGQRYLKRDCVHEHWPLGTVASHLFPVDAPATILQRSRIYARAPLSANVLRDCDLSEIEAMMGQRAKLAYCGLWIGSALNITPFHYDTCHGFLVQIIGSKTFTFVEPEQWRCMYTREIAPEISEIDFERWRGLDVEAARLEMQRHPRFAQARLSEVTLSPGDVLYTPPFWFHHVVTSSAGPAASVLVPFDQCAVEAAALGAHNVCHHFR